MVRGPGSRSRVTRIAGKEIAMSKCDSRHTSTTKIPLDKRERHPHQSGQEYEYGETPQTGLGGAGAGSDPDAQCARRGDAPFAREDESSTRQGGGGSEDQGFARDRDDKHPARKGGRRAKFDDNEPQTNIKGQHGIPADVEHSR